MSPHTEDHSTPEKDFTQHLQYALKPLSKAIRGHQRGEDVDISSAQAETARLIDAVVNEVVPRKDGPQAYAVSDLIASYWDQIAQRREATKTGIKGLDHALSGGLYSNGLVVLLGAPGSGKTTLANQIGVHVAANKRPVLYITSEDSPHTLLAKTIARLDNIDYSAVLRGYPSEQEKINNSLRGYGESTGAHFMRYVDATQGITLDGIYEQAQGHFKALEAEANGAPVLIVDYLQRLSRFENLGIDARQSATVYVERLGAMARHLHFTMIVLSAMNRASGYHAENSVIAASKESGDIEYSADVIMAIGAQKDAIDPEPGTRSWMLRVDKNRWGTTTYGEHIPLRWTPGHQRFVGELEVSEEATAYSGANGRARRGR